MKKIVNTTPHAIRFQASVEKAYEVPRFVLRMDIVEELHISAGDVYEVPPCGVLISACPVEEPAGVHASGAELVKTKFVASPEDTELLARLEEENPGAVIVGSIIAAQAFPGRVLALVPVAGFERVPIAEKRMRDDKFTAF